MTEWKSVEDVPMDGTVVDLDISGRIVARCRWDEAAWGWVDADSGHFVRGEDETVERWRSFTPSSSPLPIRSGIDL